MPDDRSRKENHLARFDSMTTDELADILRRDAANLEGTETDTETLLYITELLARRRREAGDPVRPAREALEDFKEHYLPCEDPVDVPDDLKAVSNCRPKHRAWLRRLSGMAAVIAIILLCSVVVNAFGFDIWENFAQWTQETFRFGDSSVVSETNAPSKDDPREFDSLQEVLEMKHIFLAVPSWIPTGYELDKIVIEENPSQSKYIAAYISGTQMMRIQIRRIPESDAFEIEQYGSVTEKYYSAGIAYHIFDDGEQLKAVWKKDIYECMISGDVTMEQLKRMIDSIE